MVGHLELHPNRKCPGIPLLYQCGLCFVTPCGCASHGTIASYLWQVAIEFETYRVGEGFNKQLRKGMHIPKSIHSFVIVGLVECCSCVQCAYASSIHLWVVMQSSNERKFVGGEICCVFTLFFCARHYGFLDTFNMYSLVSESFRWIITGQRQPCA